jgi:septum formation protein
MPKSPLILASASAARQSLLRNAGLIFDVVPATVDEEFLKTKLRAEGRPPRAQAEGLAEMKALSVSVSNPGCLVIGADQMLACGTEVYDKPANRDQARLQLTALRGKPHELLTAVVVAKGAEIIWKHTDTPRLTMRDFSADFLETYLDDIGDSAMKSVGAYQLEGRGAQLFDKIEGDYFSILGLPLLPLLAFLREQNLVTS